MSKKRSVKPVTRVREAARAMVRELGMLGDAHGSLGVGNSHVHTLIELEREEALSVNDLAIRLCLEKSSVSRLVDVLELRNLVKTGSDPVDGRRRIVSLTSTGQKKLAAIHKQANRRVQAALQQLNSSEQEEVARGLELYARALRSSASNDFV